MDEIQLKPQRFGHTRIQLLIWGGATLVMAFLMYQLVAFWQASAQTDEPPVPGDVMMQFESALPAGGQLIPRELVEQALNEAVANGQMSQEAADEVLGKIETAAAPLSIAFNQSFDGVINVTGSTAGVMTHPAIPMAEPMPAVIPTLLDAVEQGILTNEEMQQILTSYETAVGEGFNIEVETPAEGQENVTIMFEAHLADPVDFTAAWQTALAEAVANGTLTQAEADQLAEQLTNFTPPAGAVHIQTLALPGVPFEAGGVTMTEDVFVIHGELLEVVTARLQEAVTAGTLTQAEADELLNKLTPVLEEN